MTTPLRERAIAVLVNNRPDVLARIAATLSARGFNIESISANVTRDPTRTKIVLTALTTPETITRIMKHLDRLIDVLDVRRVRRVQTVWRELLLARVPLGAGREATLQALLQSRGGRIVSRDAAQAIVEFTGDREAIDGILGELAALGMEEMTRSGVVALEQGKGSGSPSPV